MRFDDLEFLISQYADGTLDPERLPEVEAVLQDDSVARDLLESYQGLDAALDAAGRLAVPGVQWDDLQARISRQIAVLASGPTSVGDLPEEVEAQLAGYADATLTPAEARLVEARLAADPHARLVVASYTSLERAFDALRADRPAVRWNALGEHLSAALDAATGHAAARVATPAAVKTAAANLSVGSFKLDAYRTAAGSVAPVASVSSATAAGAGVSRFAALRGGRPASSGVAGRIGRWVAEPRRLAVAACLLVAGSVSFQLLNGTGGTGGVGPTPIVSPAVNGGTDGGTAVAKTDDKPAVAPPPSAGGPAVANPGGQSVADVQVGPPPGGVDRAAFDAYGDKTTAGVARSSVISKDRSAARDHARKDANDTASAFPR